MSLHIRKFTCNGYILRWLLSLAIISFFISLGLPYIGEEGVYTISSYEMWYYQQFLYPTLVNIPYWRPPLFNWFIIPVANYLGWDHMLLAARFIAASATIATGFILIWLAKHVFKLPQFGLFAALIYFTSDASFYHGWIAYADPLFAFFISSAIACLWVANLERRFLWLCFSVGSLVAAYMTKALTAYVFYSVAFLTIAQQEGKHAFILRPFSILIQSLAIVFPFLWYVVTQGVTGKMMLGDISQKFLHISPISYSLQLIVFPLEVVCRFLPASALAIYYFLKNRLTKLSFDNDLLRVLLGILFINLLPYWLGPHSGIRYILPLYPFIALFIAMLLWDLSKPAYNRVIVWLAVAIVVKYLWLIFLASYQHYFRGDYQHVAKHILLETQGFPLYANDTVATGLSVIAHIDSLRHPKPPLQHSRFAKESSYFLINDKLDLALGNPYKLFYIGKQGTPVYLLCKGTACYVK